MRATFISCIRSALTSFSQRGGGECIVSHINQVSDPQQTDQNQIHSIHNVLLVHFQVIPYTLSETYVFVFDFIH